ncbi:hypothetical protein EZY14_010235 [Kordia sp. TARA_039_SRF]|nr:hypothetical protein EZY14_010235 [Kordia sp. TARA_039_SRF]
MSVKDFFVTVVKVLAIYFFFAGIIPLVTNLILYRDTYDTSKFFELLGVILLFVAIVYLMLSQSKSIVKFLRLDKGFSTDSFDFSNMNRGFIMEATIAIMGLYMVLFVVPYILMDVYTLLKSNINTPTFSIDKTPEMLKENLIINFLYILVGLVIIFLRKPIANLFATNTTEK